jgi:hypothetical protein
MERKTKRGDIEREGMAEQTASEEIVNDSLGTVDTADSTGLDTELEKEHGVESESPEPDGSAAKSDQADGAV